MIDLGDHLPSFSTLDDDDDDVDDDHDHEHDDANDNDNDICDTTKMMVCTEN